MLLDLFRSLSWLDLGAIAVGVYALTRFLSSEWSLRHIPVVSPPRTSLSSWLRPFPYVKHTHEMVWEGSRKYPGGIFRLSMPGRWNVVIAQPQLIEEMRQAPDEELGFHEAVAETLHTEYTLGHTSDNLYHVKVVRRQLTKNLTVKYDEIHDEVASAFTDRFALAGVNDADWTAIYPLPLALQVVGRTSNRLFVGLPLCRDEDWLDLNINFTVDVVNAGRSIDKFPRFLRPIVGPMYSPLPQARKRAMQRLGPLVTERLAKDNELGKNWEGRPNDLISWMLEEATGPERNLDGIMRRIMGVNFAALHTSSMGFTLAFLHLAANPQYIQPLREEVEYALQKDKTSGGDGTFSTAFLKELVKMDSFFRESQRFYGLGCLSMQRLVLDRKGFTFSNGIHLPYGTAISAASTPVHRDETNYKQANEFDPFRFVNGEDGHNVKMVNTDMHYITFGHGKHACPGRFFAATELKTMMAHVVLNYDFKFPDGYDTNGKAPTLWNSQALIPDPRAEVLIKKRVW